MNFPVIVQEKSREACRKVYVPVAGCKYVGVFVIKAKSVVINETFSYSAFIINIFGTPKNITTTEVS